MEQKEKDSKRFITPAGAGIVAICFFLPWVRLGVQGFYHYDSGLQIANMSNSCLMFWLILIAAIAIVVAFFVFEGQNNLKKMKPIVLVGAILSILIMVIGNQQQIGCSRLSEIQYGSVGTLIGFIISVFGLQFLR